MSDDLPRELNVLVERVVRPLPIPLSRQRRLRTEFLEHLREIYAEELTLDSDPAAAMNRTHERFGNPKELTAELHSTIRWWERWEYWLQLRVEQQAHESSWQYVIRLLAIMMAMMLFGIGMTMADHHFFGTGRISLLKLQVAIAATVFLAVWMGGVVTFGLQMGAEWDRHNRRWSRILLSCAGMLAAWPLSLAVLMFVAGGTWADYSIPYAGSILGGMMNVVMGTVFGVLHRRDTIYRREWAELVLDSA